MTANNNQVVYIIDTYNKFSKDKIISTFKINGNLWAIKEVHLEWGLPQLSNIEEDHLDIFQVYETLEEAQNFVHKLKQIEGVYF